MVKVCYHPDDATLNGVAIYIDNNTLRPVRAMLAWDKSFAAAHAADERAARNGGPSEFSKQYPLEEPTNPELGGWNGVFPSLTLCVGVAVSKLCDNDCLVRSGGAFIWTERTMAKSGRDREKQMRFLFQMMHLFYSLLMGGDAIIDGVPFQQCLGPLSE